MLVRKLSEFIPHILVVLLLTSQNSSVLSFENHISENKKKIDNSRNYMILLLFFLILFGL
jgi:hypothetical protein